MRKWILFGEEPSDGGVPKPVMRDHSSFYEVYNPAPDAGSFWIALVHDLDHAKLIAAAPEMAEMLLSMFVHVSHGGPTREQAEALLKKAGVL